MFHNNPLKVENYIVPEIHSLQRLIQLLTNATDVIIETSIDPDVGFCGNSPLNHIKIIKSIGVQHEVIVREFKYSYQEQA
jgi:hypothetical protein